MVSDSFSQAVDNLLIRLRPCFQHQTSYPANLDQRMTRFNSGESIWNWFGRMVNDWCMGDPELCKIEDNIALFASLFWRENRLVGANIIALITSCELTEYLIEPPDNCEEMYLRLDYDDKTLGDPFSHPIPHIHVFGDLSPRFALDGGNADNVVMDFLEFIYRQFVPIKWKSWAEHEWNQDYFRRNGDHNSNPFPLMMKAFEESQISILREHEKNLKKLKRLLRDKKDRLFNYSMNGTDRELLEYPEARS